MILRHATPRSNLESILRDGLLPSKSQGVQQVVWLHTKGRTPWAILHTMGRHRGGMEDTVMIELSIPRRWLTRAQKGLWKCGRVIPASRFCRIAPASEWAASPIKEN